MNDPIYAVISVDPQLVYNACEKVIDTIEEKRSQFVEKAIYEKMTGHNESWAKRHMPTFFSTMTRAKAAKIVKRNYRRPYVRQEKISKEIKQMAAYAIIENKKEMQLTSAGFDAIGDFIG